MVRYTNHGNTICPNYWLCEDNWMTPEMELKIIRGKLCLIDTKHKFAYLWVDKEGMIHIPPSVGAFGKKKLRYLISACTQTWFGFNTWLWIDRGMPRMEIAKEFNDYGYSCIEERTWMIEGQEIVISPQGKIVSGKMPKKPKAHTSEW